MKSIGYVSELTRKELGCSIQKATLPRIKKALSRKGYIVWNYSVAQNKLAVLGLLNEAKKAKSISFVDENNILIFVDDSITEEMQLFAIVHEIGHIKLEHKTRQISKDEQEREADDFAANFLLRPTFNVWKFVSMLLAAILLLCSVSFFFFKEQPVTAPTSNQPTSSNSVKTTYYWTENGTVYHCYKDCPSLSRSYTVFDGSLSQAQELKDRLCKFCEKRYEEN